MERAIQQHQKIDFAGGLALLYKLIICLLLSILFDKELDEVKLVPHHCSGPSTPHIFVPFCSILCS